MSILPIVLFAAGVTLGLVVALAVWGFARSAMAQTQGQLATREAALARVQQDLSAAQQDRARLGAELVAERNAAGASLALLQDAESKLREAFSALSSEALRQNNQSFLALAKTSLSEFQQTARLDLDGRQKAIEDLVQPLKESLTLVDAKLHQVEQTRV